MSLRLMQPLVVSRLDPAVLAALVFANLLALAVPLAMVQVHDRIIPNEGYETLAALALILVVAIVFEAILRAARSALLHIAAERFEVRAYATAFRALLNENPVNESRLSPGEIHARLTGVENVRASHVGEAALAGVDLPFAIVFVGVIFLISPTLGFATLAMMAVTILVLACVRLRVQALQLQRQAIEDRRLSFISGMLRSVDVVKGLRIEDFMQRRYERLMAASADVTADLSGSVHTAQGFAASAGAVTPAAIGALGAFQVIDQELTIGALAAVVLLSGRMMQPVLRMEASLAGRASARRARRDVGTLVELPARPEGGKPLAAVEHLTVKRFAGPGDGQVTVGLSLSRGDCLLIEGGSAQKRREFLRAFRGETQVGQGSIDLNGRPLEEYALGDLKDRMRFLVAGEGFLNGSLIENMTGFDVARHRDEAIRLAGALGIDDFISRTAEGYRMHVGGAVSPLPRSISDACGLVAALVKDPDVILFDRANATLDRDMDRLLLEELQRRAPRTILVMVSDRPSYQKLATHRLDIETELGTDAVS